MRLDAPLNQSLTSSEPLTSAEPLASFTPVASAPGLTENNAWLTPPAPLSLAPKSLTSSGEADQAELATSQPLSLAPPTLTSLSLVKYAPTSWSWAPRWPIIFSSLPRLSITLSMAQRPPNSWPQTQKRLTFLSRTKENLDPLTNRPLRAAPQNHASSHSASGQPENETRPGDRGASKMISGSLPSSMPAPIPAARPAVIAPLVWVVLLAFGLFLAPPALAQTEACPTACQSGLEKLTAEKAKNQRRREVYEEFQRTSQTTTQNCLGTILGANYPTMGFPAWPDLSQLIAEICRSTRLSLPTIELSLPQLVIKETLK